MQPNQRGFTLLELTVVLVLMAIIGAYVAGRSITTDQMYLAGQVDKIRNQIRYAQSTAMKRTDTVWGIHNNAGQYWFFQTDTGNPVLLPGEENAQITLAGLDVDTMTPDPFTIFFDGIGKPYTAYTSETVNTPLAATLVISVSAGGASKNIDIIPETGLAQ